MLNAGAVHFLWLGACRAAGPPFEEVGPRMFSKQHPMASRALAPAFDRWCPAPLSRFPTMRLQALSARLQVSLSGGRMLPDPLHPRLPLAPSADRAAGLVLPRLPGLRVPAVGRAADDGLRRAVRVLDTPESRHIPLIERPSRKWARRISPILSTPSIPRSPESTKEQSCASSNGAGLEFRPCPKGTQLHAESQSAARGGLRGICGRPGKSGHLPPGSLRPRIFGWTRPGNTPPRRQDGVASAGGLGWDSGRHPIIHVG